MTRTRQLFARELPPRGARAARFARARAAAVALAALAVAVRAEPAYRITDLGTLGGKTSRARAINGDGTVAGEAETKSGALHAFIWKAGQGMKDLGTLGGGLSRAYAINDRGIVVGESETTNGTSLAFRWSEEAGMTGLALPAGMQGACAFAVNHYGAIAGAGETGEGSRALRWEMGSVTELITNGAAFHAARAINDEGLIAGQMAASATDHFSSVAFARPADPGAPLATLAPPSGGGSSAAHAVNRKGVIAGFAEIREGRIHAMQFGPDRATDLDTMNNAHSSAIGINDAGDVVGSFFNGAGDDDRAFLWRDGEMFDLNDLAEEADDWILVEASGINQRGEIAGYGVKDGVEHAVLLTPLPGDRKNTVSVTLLQPTNNAVFVEPSDLRLAAGAQAEAGVKRVIFQANDETIAVVTNEPYAFVWRGVRAGDYDVSAMAVTPRSEARRSRRVRVRVALPNQVPEAWIVHPNAHEKLAAGRTNELAAAADDADGKIVALRLVVDGAVVAVSNNTGYLTFDWVAPGGGTVELRAEATDESGCTVTSPVVRAESAAARP